MLHCWKETQGVHLLCVCVCVWGGGWVGVSLHGLLNTCIRALSHMMWLIWVEKWVINESCISKCVWVCDVFACALGCVYQNSWACLWMDCHDMMQLNVDVRLILKKEKQPNCFTSREKLLLSVRFRETVLCKYHKRMLSLGNAWRHGIQKTCLSQLYLSWGEHSHKYPTTSSQRFWVVAVGIRDSRLNSLLVCLISQCKYNINWQ